MQTRSKFEIFKKKLFNCQNQLNLDISEPSTACEALTHVKWKKAMQKEFKPLPVTRRGN